MQRALDEARRAFWWTHPNPMVGAVVVRDDTLLAVGHHARAGLPHAEVDALSKLPQPDAARGAELFCTLEPCHHRARTGPCTEAIISAGIRRCVIGTVDRDERVSGRGIAALEAAGIEVVVGVLQEACEALNRPFFKRVTRGLPFVTAKVAMTLDGKIATRTGHSQWISGPEARLEVHRMRALHDAVLVGTGTLLADDPRLTTRLPEGEATRQPLRVVLDRELKATQRAVYRDQDTAPTLLVTAHERVEEAQQRFPGVDVLGVTSSASGLDLDALLRTLARREITTLLCEGGGELIASLVEAQLVDRYVAFVAPTLIGGHDAPGPVGGVGAETLQQAQRLRMEGVKRVGDDLMITATFDET